MREIKFRAWDKEDNVMDYSMSFAGNISENMNDKPGIGEGERFSELMQCTGLKDKNGKEIYEGDICWTYEVGIGNLNREVIFDSGSFLFRHKHCLLTELRGWKHDYIEVIGNIWEHPHLLNQETCDNTFS